MLSIIIPTYNSLHDLKITLPALMRSIGHFSESVKDVPIEIIISDDGSIDGSQEWVRHKYPEIRYCWHENLGRGPNRNFGADQAKGGIFVFLDSDVELERNTLCELVRPFIQGDDQVCFPNILLKISDHPSPLDKYLAEKWKKLMARFSKTLDPWESYSTLFAIRSDVFKASDGFISPFREYSTEDTEYFVRLNFKGVKFTFVNMAICWHHQPLGLKANLRRTYISRYSATFIPHSRPVNLEAEIPMGTFSQAWYDQIFKFLIINKLWSKLRFLHLLFQYFPQDNRLAFYFYHFLFQEYAEKGYHAGKRANK